MAASMNSHEGVLCISTTWDKTTGTLIGDFCEKTLNKTPNTIPAGYCTVLDVEVSEETQNEAASYGVTLIPASRNKLIDPHEDPPVVNWLINHNNYYPELKRLKTIIGHVVGLSEKTKNAASVIHQSLFPGAKFHQMPSKPAALFVAHAWNNDELGLTGFHRNLVQDFCARKAEAGEDLKTYSTVLDVKISDDQRKDAESCGVTLIPAQPIFRGIEAKHEAPRPDWLLSQEIYYPKLDKIENVQYVVGYAPKTGFAAAHIRRKLFPGAKLVLINHACPEKNCLQAEEYGLVEFEEKMLHMASEADLVFSIGPTIHQYFQNAYRAELNGKQLSEIPHEEILPRPKSCSLGKVPEKEEIGQHHILTCGQMDTQEAIQRCDVLAVSIGNAANSLKESHSPINSPVWKIQGVSQQADKTVVKFLSDMMQCPHIQPKLHPGHSAKSLLRSLQQSHLCLPAPWYTDYSFYGMEAMVSGLPTAVEEYYHLAHFITKHFEQHAMNCIASSQINDNNLSNRIVKHLQKTSLDFKMAKALKKDLKGSEVITTSYARFTTLLTSATKQQTDDENRQHEVERDMEDSLTVQIGLDDTIFQQHLRDLEKRPPQALPAQMSWEQVKEVETKVKAALKRQVEEKVADEDKLQVMKKVCMKILGYVVPKSWTAESLAILLRFLTLYNLYRLKQTCLSGNLAKAFEPLLITDEMRKMASQVGVQLKLKATYNEKKFKGVELFFMNRDGGGIQPVEIYDDVGKEENKDCIDEAGSVVSEDTKVIETGPRDIHQRDYGQKLEEPLTQHNEPSQPITPVHETLSLQARSLLLHKPSENQLTDSEIRYLELAQSKVHSSQSQLDKAKSKLQSLQSQLDKAFTEKQILETQVAEASHAKAQQEKQCQEYIQRCHSAEKMVAAQLSDIHKHEDIMKRLDPQNVENLQTKLKEKDKLITELRTRLSQLSDEQSDIELQKKKAESLQLGGNVSTEMEDKGVPDTTVDNVHAKTEMMQTEKEKPRKPEMTVKHGSEIETPTSTHQHEKTTRDGNEMETATPTQPEMTGRDGSEIETATPTQPETTGREGLSEMETTTPTNLR
ncbi:polyamine-modulated factor 1-binding protein 1-like [Ptychodera flava]|uniref:polyamine-modulated factor 1-binding protein 1-like n=1 Tax=Ptychodera flava TaxID=63121 RepID=UPI003969F4A3